MVDQVRVVVRSLERFTTRLVQGIALNVTANLVENPPQGTPIDTAWASSNWIPRIGGPVTTPDGSREAVSRGAQQAGIASVAATYALTRGPIYVSNPVPYIGRLNRGSSRQSPAMFVEAAILRAVRQALGLQP